MAESSSASEGSRSPSPARAVNGPKSSRTFVWLRELPKAIPRGKPWDQLNRDGRVRDIEFGKKFTERQMGDLVRENFPELGEADFRRIRLYKSGSRGSVLKKVAKNIPAASTLLSKFSGGASKRIYILLKSDDSNGVPVSSAQAKDNSQNPTPPVTGNAGGPPMLPLPRGGFSTRQYITSLAQSTTQETDNDSTVSPGNDTCTFQGAWAPTSPLLAAHSNTNSVIQLTIDDDADLEQSPFDNSVTLLDPIQASRATKSTKSSTNSRSLSTSGSFGTPFYSEGTKVGTVAGDMSPHGLGEESDLPSRTNEVVRCEERLLASCRGENTSLPSFLIHSFDELCWQARTFTMVLCIVLLNPRREDAGVREGIVRALRWLSAQSQGKCLLYWPAETTSTDGRRVCNMFGVRYTSDTVLLVVPSSSSVWNPRLLEEIADSSITATNVEDRLATALEKATDLLKALSTQREKIETFRKDRAEQDDDLLREQHTEEKNDRKEREKKEKEEVQEDKNKEEEEEEEQNKEEDNDNQEKAARSARKARLNVEPVLGSVIRIRSQNGILQRRFPTGAHFQEVYDWAGANESFPPYFTLHRGSVLVSHEETIAGNETLDVTEREEGEMESFFKNKVSFKGNFSYPESLEETLEDPVTSRAEQEDESDDENDREKNVEEKKKRKRKKDPKRTTAKRLKKKKANNS